MIRAISAICALAAVPCLIIAVFKDANHMDPWESNWARATLVLLAIGLVLD